MQYERCGLSRAKYSPRSRIGKCVAITTCSACTEPSAVDSRHGLPSSTDEHARALVDQRAVPVDGRGQSLRVPDGLELQLVGEADGAEGLERHVDVVDQFHRQPGARGGLELRVDRPALATRSGHR